MTTNLITRKNNKLQLNGNLLTGDTFPVKDYIKKYFDGKWDSNAKGWRVDAEKVMSAIGTAYIGLTIDTDASPAAKISSSWYHYENGVRTLNEDY